MKLKEFSVENYRSITSASKIKLQDFTVLVGKNNEGKSNLINALNIAMKSLKNYQRTYRYAFDEIYDWKKDFPLQLQHQPNESLSTFSLLFGFENDEVDEFRRETIVRGVSEINVQINIGKKNYPVILFPTRGWAPYSKKWESAIEFICRKIKFNYIQTVRTEDMVRQSLSSLIDSRLEELKKDPVYKNAEQTILHLKQKSLDDLASGLIDPLKKFLPEVRDLKIKLVKEKNYLWGEHNPFDVIIDDGMPTSISTKGDGVKSVVSLAFLKEIRGKSSGTSIIAIEEPESHLHSGAIHGLVDVLNKLSLNNQIIITTHNPLFVRRDSLSSNIIVDSGKAKTAKSIEEIRNILGVWVSDNLTNAKYVFFVEGEDDRISLMKILPAMSKKIEKVLKNGSLVIKPLHGAGNLSHDVTDVKNSLCQCCALLDNDEAGKKAADKAVAGNVISQFDIKFTKCAGSPETEFEDCIQPKVYAEAVLNEFNVDISSCKSFRGRDKWSVRMGRAFSEFGSAWNDKVKENVKMCVANSLPSKISDISDVLIPQKSTFLEGVKIMIEKMIDEK